MQEEVKMSCIRILEFHNQYAPHVSAPTPTTLGRESATQPNNDEIPSTPCDEDESRDNVPIYRKAKQPKARLGQVTNEILVARKMDSTLLHDEVYGKNTRGYLFNVERQLCALCTTIGTTHVPTLVGRSRIVVVAWLWLVDFKCY